MQKGMRRFKKWCEDNGFGYTNGYKIINSGAIKAMKVGALTYITDEEDARWKANLPAFKPKNMET